MKFKPNVPNNITIIRVCLIPIFLIILNSNIKYRDIIAAFIFIMLSLSDLLDGYFARKKNQVTEFGKLIDPIADKLLICTALVFLVGRGVDLWMAIVIIVREVLLTAIRFYLLRIKIMVPAGKLGKAKTLIESIAITMVLLQIPFSWYAMLVSVALAVISGIEYLWHIRKMTGNKIVNLPNSITFARFTLIIPFFISFSKGEMAESLILFAIITLSDKLDGISARLMNQKTELGSGFDSFTDWTLIITSLFLFGLTGKIGMFWVPIFLFPSLVSGTMKMVYAKKLKVVPVTLIARTSVGMTYITIVAVIIGLSYKMLLLYLTTISVYLASIVYVWKAYRIINKHTQKKFILK